MVKGHQVRMMFNLYCNLNQSRDKTFLASIGITVLYYSILHYVWMHCTPCDAWITSRFEMFFKSKICTPYNKQAHNHEVPSCSMQLYIENAVHIIMQGYFCIFLLEFLYVGTLGEQNVIILKLAYKGINIVSWLGCCNGWRIPKVVIYGLCSNCISGEEHINNELLIIPDITCILFNTKCMPTRVLPYIVIVIVIRWGFIERCYNVLNT